MPNRLINSTSPYLLQHAHNPVDWYEWGTEALARAKNEDKPILVSIGYSSCHWCHVMERESFENHDIAKIMNEHFVCIKVDREERPDVDHIYMEAVQAMQQNGGWPLNVFLTPDQQPFYGGTYFPPNGWAQLLLKINQAFRKRRTQIESSAADLTAHLQMNDVQRFAQAGTFRKDSLDRMFGILQQRFDNVYGGLDKAPKFVMPTIWLLLLRYHKITSNETALSMVTKTLEKMGDGGIYDQVAGGFARYSVDNRWFAPHFEKMLYDNAQLLSLYAEAYQVTQSPAFRNIISETATWLEKEMTHSEGGIYSALDADSEGVEGKYYTFTYDEWVDALGPDAADAATYFNVTIVGNWEHGRNILTKNAQQSVDLETIDRWKQKLAAAQKKRIRPGLDDKILAGWNAMTAKGLIDAYRATGEERYLSMAKKCMSFLEDNLIHNGHIYRSFKDSRSITEGFLEDYAWTIYAYTALYQATFDERALQNAETWMNYTLEHFLDHEDGFFHFSSSQSEQLIARKKEIFDNVIPSSNSVMARNLLHLGTLLDRNDWKEHAEKMVSSLVNVMEGEPGYLSNWGIALTEWIHPLHEVAIVGTAYQTARKELSKHYQPFALLAGTTGKSSLPLLVDKQVADGNTMLFVCQNKTCRLPVATVDEALQQLG